MSNLKKLHAESEITYDQKVFDAEKLASDDFYDQCQDAVYDSDFDSFKKLTQEEKGNLVALYAKSQLGDDRGLFLVEQDGLADAVLNAITNVKDSPEDEAYIAVNLLERIREGLISNNGRSVGEYLTGMAMYANHGSPKRARFVVSYKPTEEEKSPGSLVSFENPSYPRINDPYAGVV